MRIALITCLLAAQAAAAEFDIYVQVTPGPGMGAAPPGAAAVPFYSGWIEADGFSAGSSFPTSIGTPPTTNRASLLPITLVKSPDAATPVMFSEIAVGAVLDMVKFAVVRKGVRQTELWDVKCETAAITRQEISFADGKLSERLELVSGRTEVSYIMLKPDGDPLNEVFAWLNIMNNTLSYGSRSPVFPAKADTDGDSMPDGWETFYGLNPAVADADGDADKDGLSNVVEFRAGTDPLKPQSAFQLLSVAGPAAGQMSLTWTSSPGYNYLIESAVSPAGPFTLVRTVPAFSPGTTTTASVAAAPNRLFFRVTPETP